MCSSDRIERLNRTISQGAAYRNGRARCECGRKRTLEEHLELRRGYYNIGRRERALKFGREGRNPEMRAGLAGKCLGVRDIFTARVHFVPFVILVSLLATPRQRGEFATRAA